MCRRRARTSPSPAGRRGVTSLKYPLPRQRWSCQLPLDGAMDIAVYVVGADQLDDSVCAEHRQDLRIRSRDAKRHVVCLKEVEDLLHLRRALRLDEFELLQVEHERQNP